MISRTHLAIGLAIALYFAPHVKNKIIFIPIVLLSSLLPDIDSSCSVIGKKQIFRPVQLFVKHRGFIHSYSLCIVISFVFAFFYPVLTLPFFLGYSFHLFADSFTIQGIRPFWPLKYESQGHVRTGGVIDSTIFFVFIIIDIFLLLFMLN